MMVPIASVADLRKESPNLYPFSLYPVIFSTKSVAPSLEFESGAPTLPPPPLKELEPVSRKSQ